MDRKSSDVEDEHRDNPEGTPPPVANIEVRDDLRAMLEGDDNDLLDNTFAMFCRCLFAIGQSSNTPATLADAENFLRRVQTAFRDTPEKYAEFVELIMSVNEQRMSTNAAFLRAFDLFGNHLELVEEFIKFYLPTPYDEYLASTISTEDSSDGASPSRS